MSVETIGDIRKSKTMRLIRQRVMTALLTDPRTKTEYDGHFPGQELLPDDARAQKVLTSKGGTGSTTSISIGCQLSSSYYGVPPALWVVHATASSEGSSVFTFAGNDMRGHTFPEGTQGVDGIAEFYDFSEEAGINAARAELERILDEIEQSRYDAT